MSRRFASNDAVRLRMQTLRATEHGVTENHVPRADPAQPLRLESVGKNLADFAVAMRPISRLVIAALVGCLACVIAAEFSSARSRSPTF